MSDRPDPALSRSPIFAGLSQEALSKVCACGRVLSFDSGDVLFERGQDARELMILQEGVVELLFPIEIMGVTRSVTMESKQLGDVVAWSALVPPYHFTLSARCATRCKLTSFKREALHDFFETQPDTGYRCMRNLAGVIGRRLQSMQTIWMRDLQTRAAKRLE